MILTVSKRRGVATSTSFSYTVPSRKASNDFFPDADLRGRAQAFEESGKAVIATDTRGRIHYWNEAAEKLYGWSADEVLGRHIVDVTPSLQSRAEAAHIMRRLRSGESWSGAFGVQDRDGRTFRVEVTDSPVFSRHGKLVGVVGVSSRLD